MHTYELLFLKWNRFEARRNNRIIKRLKAQNKIRFARNLIKKSHLFKSGQAEAYPISALPWGPSFKKKAKP